MQERLQKVLARAGVASRRKSEDLILQGRVEVDGRKVTELGTKVDAARQLIRVDGVLVADIADPVYYVLFKPAGCVSTMNDPEGRPSLAEYGARLPERIFPVGRLDYDAEGALLLTNDGELAHRLMHPRFGAKRTYLAKVKGEVKPAAIDKLRAGVRLDDGPARPEHASISSVALKNTWLKLVLTEGRTHLVKRLCDAVGHPVQRLFRSDYAGVGVEGMMPGELRELNSLEIRMLKAGGGTPLGATLPPRRDARRDPSGRIRVGAKKPPKILLSSEEPVPATAAEVVRAQREAAERSHGHGSGPGERQRKRERSRSFEREDSGSHSGPRSRPGSGARFSSQRGEREILGTRQPGSENFRSGSARPSGGSRPASAGREGRPMQGDGRRQGEGSRMGNRQERRDGGRGGLRGGPGGRSPHSAGRTPRSRAPRGRR